MNFRVPICVIALSLLLPLYAQDKKELAPKIDTPPVNLKVLKVATREEAEQIMRTFASGLGVQCSYCHVQDNFASDDNPKKEVARRMIKMIQKINADFPDGKMHVSCYTCHRGETEPKTAPRQ
ncbi:MAG TPA: c-type cytochrome [Pyrinomonadaceae bacterium]|nr:c-type cytochrome [Pyrinomonadaceae bacterium]